MPPETTDPSSPAPTPSTPAPPKPDHRARLVVVTLVFGIALFFGLRYLAENWSRESTDDAFVDGHIVSIASKVPGEVVATHVIENQAVKAGDLLVEVDPQDFDVRVSQKRASLQSAQSSLEAFQAGLELLRARITTADATRKQSEAQAEASKSTFENAEANWNRARNLWTNQAHEVLSEQDFENSKAAMTTARANWQADVEKAASDASKVIEARAQLTASYKLFEQAGAQVTQAQADLKAADLQLAYTKIFAPVDGRVTRKMVEKGAYLQVGQNLLAIVRPEIWVTANFKETQTAKIRPGQSAEIKMDGLAGGPLRGHVESLQSGSGSRFSLLPPENAVGNYVKIVQRVPVRIDFDDSVQAAQGLGPGMSVSPSVEIGRRALSDPVIAVISLVIALVAGGMFWLFLRRKS
jgi:membrane fusion protein, multidrug efflux system